MLSGDIGDEVEVNGNWGTIGQPGFGMPITIKITGMHWQSWGGGGGREGGREGGVSEVFNPYRIPCIHLCDQRNNARYLKYLALSLIS